VNRRQLLSYPILGALALQPAAASSFATATSETGDASVNTAVNKALMQKIFAGIAVADTKLFVDSLADDIVMRVTGQYSWSRTFNGKAALMKDLYGYLRTVVAEAGKTIPLRFMADEDYVVVEARGDMVTKTGVKYDNEYCLVFRLRDGKIVEMREYCDSVLTEKVLGKYPQAQ
jgi:uncharacterized protein